MDGVLKYILQIVSAVILCAVVKTILPDSNVPGKLLRVISGVFITFTVLSPVLELRLDNYSDLISDLSLSASQLTDDGQKMAHNAMAEIIIDNTQEYILNEADKMNLDIDVEILTNESNPPAPYAVIIRGNISPYYKTQLGDIIENQLGISEENTQWIPIR